jgi:hypothetical protein
MCQIRTQCRIISRSMSRKGGGKLGVFPVQNFYKMKLNFKIEGNIRNINNNNQNNFSKCYSSVLNIPGRSAEVVFVCEQILYYNVIYYNIIM